MKISSRIGCIIGLIISVAVRAVIIATEPEPTPPPPKTEVADNQTVSTETLWSLPVGTVIHKDYGNDWYCVELDQEHYLFRHSSYDALVMVRRDLPCISNEEK